MKIEIRDPVFWQSCEDKRREDKDGYAGMIVDYAEQWAVLMQEKMAAGEKLEDMASSASHEADTMGMSGAGYHQALFILARCWKHGDALADAMSMERIPYNSGANASETPQSDDAKQKLRKVRNRFGGRKL